TSSATQINEASAQSRVARDPTINAASSVDWVRKPMSTTYCMKATDIAATAIPAMITRAGETKPLPVNTYTTPAAISAPAAAPAGTGTTPGHSSVAAAAPAPAPEVSPMMSGLPSGLRVTV